LAALIDTNAFSLGQTATTSWGVVDLIRWRLGLDMKAVMALHTSTKLPYTGPILYWDGWLFVS